jgi:hypothetical protein
MTTNCSAGRGALQLQFVKTNRNAWAQIKRYRGNNGAILNPYQLSGTLQKHRQRTETETQFHSLVESGGAFAVLCQTIPLLRGFQTTESASGWRLGGIKEDEGN